VNRGLKTNPLAGELPHMLVRYGADTSLGRNLPKGDAKLLLDWMRAFYQEIRKHASNLPRYVATEVRDWMMRELVE